VRFGRIGPAALQGRGLDVRGVGARGLGTRGLGARGLGAMICLVALAGPAAQAQVIDVRADGTAVSYAGPVISTAHGVSPIMERPAAQGSARRSAPADAARVVESLHAAALRHGVSEPLAEAVAWRESRFRQNALSPKGARGVMQLTPGTARSLGVDAADLAANLDGGTAYLAALLRRFDGDPVLALAAYNAGPQAVQRFGGVPPFAETRAYVAAVLGRLADASPAPTAVTEAR
jgi:soluble lytic murein transglycosylase-like protein